ncbi:hypothetical protein Hanom_Chr10g00896661 [Helianthus anomalus]
MVGHPHIGRTRKPNQVIDFLKVAKLVLAENEEIITFGDGEEGERTGNSSDFSLFFDNNLACYKAFYESTESGFPDYLNEAGIAIATFFSCTLCIIKILVSKVGRAKARQLFPRGSQVKRSKDA